VTQPAEPPESAQPAEQPEPTEPAEPAEGRSASEPVTTAPPEPPRPAFAHASEAEMARILDFYTVQWDYEPTAFPLRWNLDGDVIESFSPDFYLPDLDAYLEMTTLKQRLVRKKNRKLRRLRELYPEVQIKLLYARDFRALMLKYGKLALFDEMAGTSGQVVPDARSAAGAAGPEPVDAAEPPAPPATRSRRRRPAEAITTPEPASDGSSS